jgi:hypothetical protein
LLALLLACGLRRHEAVALTLDHLQQREEHWAIVDLVGKGGHVRTVPVPDWVRSELDDWLDAAVIDRGKLFRRVNKVGRAWGEGITEKAVWHIVKESARSIGVEKLAPHDLRRYAESRIMPNRDSETSCNRVKPADAPSCYLAPCGIVRCASEAMEEAQPLPSGRLTIFPFSWSASSAPQPTASARLVSRPVKNVPRRMSLANPLVDVFGISIFGWRQIMPNR